MYEFMNYLSDNGFNIKVVNGYMAYLHEERESLKQKLQETFGVVNFDACCVDCLFLNKAMSIMNYILYGGVDYVCFKLGSTGETRWVYYKDGKFHISDYKRAFLVDDDLDSHLNYDILGRPLDAMNMSVEGDTVVLSLPKVVIYNVWYDVRTSKIVKRIDYPISHWNEEEYVWCCDTGTGKRDYFEMSDDETITDYPNPNDSGVYNLCIVDRAVDFRPFDMVGMIRRYTGTSPLLTALEPYEGIKDEDEVKFGGACVGAIQVDMVSSQLELILNDEKCMSLSQFITILRQYPDFEVTQGYVPIDVSRIKDIDDTLDLRWGVSDSDKQYYIVCSVDYRDLSVNIDKFGEVLEETNDHIIIRPKSMYWQGSKHMFSPSIMEDEVVDREKCSGVVIDSNTDSWLIFSMVGTIAELNDKCNSVISANARMNIDWRYEMMTSRLNAIFSLEEVKEEE